MFASSLTQPPRPRINPMKFRSFHSIRLMVPILVTIAVLPSLLALLYSGFEARKKALQDAEHETLHLVQSMAAVQERITASTQVMLSSLTLVPSVNKVDIPACNELFREIMRQNPIYTNILMANRNGDIIASAVPYPPVNLADRKHFKDACLTGKFSTGEYIVSRTTAEPVFPFSYPLLDEQGAIQAVLIAAVELKQYKDYFSEKSFPEGSYYGIADHAGLRLFRTPTTGANFEFGRPIAPWVWDIVKNGGKQGVTTQNGSDNVRRVMAFSRLDLGPGTPAYMYMFVGIPEKILVEKASAAMFRNAVLAGGSWLLALLLSWLIGRYLFIEKIRRLTDCALLFGSGSFNMQTGVDHNAGEIGQVAAAFDAMASKLRQADLEREKLQRQLIQAQKMEAVGRLAGGVAHDFNNILSVILGYVEISLDETRPDSPIYSNLEKIQEAGYRSAEIVRQLLTFSRQQTIAPRVLDLNATVGGLVNMLQRLIGENINLVWAPAPSLPLVLVDPSQVDQMLINLCVNARDAIDGVGTLSVETAAVAVDGEFCAQNTECTPGGYVVLSVSDNGCGMTTEVMEKIFEPFYTTKGIGKGTGLGLATIYGIVKQNHGFIKLYSEPSKGTSFKIYFPQHIGDGGEEEKEGEAAIPMGRGELVLLVEDEISILELGKTMLERLGYEVIAATKPDEMLSSVADLSGPIRLLITDVVMPGMNGRELADRVRKIHPLVKCLFMSGYTSNVIAHQGVLDKGDQFIEKPFTTKTLATKVRHILDSDAEPVAE